MLTDVVRNNKKKTLSKSLIRTEALKYWKNVEFRFIIIITVSKYIVHLPSKSINARFFLLDTLVLTAIFFFEILIKSIGPLTYASNMKCEEILLFRSWTDGKWMPFELGNGWDLDEHPVSGRKIKIVRSLDNQIGHFGWEDDSGGYRSFSFAHPGGHLAVRQL